MSGVLLRSFRVGGYEYELRSVKCGKSACKKCPHGPYWYMRIHMRHKKDINKYIGKELPKGVEEPR
jgi:hypothetical protein